MRGSPSVARTRTLYSVLERRVVRSQGNVPGPIGRNRDFGNLGKCNWGCNCRAGLGGRSRLWDALWDAMKAKRGRRCSSPCRSCRGAHGLGRTTNPVTRDDRANRGEVGPFLFAKWAHVIVQVEILLAASTFDAIQSVLRANTPPQSLLSQLYSARLVRIPLRSNCFPSYTV